MPTRLTKNNHEKPEESISKSMPSKPETRINAASAGAKRRPHRCGTWQLANGRGFRNAKMAGLRSFPPGIQVRVRLEQRGPVPSPKKYHDMRNRPKKKHLTKCDQFISETYEKNFRKDGEKQKRWRWWSDLFSLTWKWRSFQGVEMQQKNGGLLILEDVWFLVGCYKINVRFPKGYWFHWILLGAYLGKPASYGTWYTFFNESDLVKWWGWLMTGIAFDIRENKATFPWDSNHH